jgi:hypothetical protein
MPRIPEGLYESLLDEQLRAILESSPEVRAVLGNLDPEEEPAR